MHEFENLERQIGSCNLPDERRERALLQHLSVRQKFFSMDSYREELLSFESDRFMDAAAQSSSTSSAIPTQLPQQLPVGLQVLFQLNRIMDGFVTNAKSVFDTLAREMQWLYDGAPIGDIYFSQWPPGQLRGRYASSSLWAIIARVKRQGWYGYLDRLRSSTVHESLISPRISLEYDPITATVPISNIYLPDDPRALPPRYRNRRDLKTFTQETDRNTVGFLEEVAATIRTDLPNIS